MGTAMSPPNHVLIGLALFLTFYTMSPVFDKIYADAYKPLSEGSIQFETAVERAAGPLRTFMLHQTRENDLALFANLAKQPALEDPSQVPLKILVPAFITSELKTAFQIGFTIFIPFLIIDLVVASVLMALGMMMVPPVTVSLPFADAVRAGRRLAPAHGLAGPELLPISPRTAMTAETVMTMTYQAMKIALAMAGPLLLVTLVVGLVISIFQAATQINEMTLSFIPAAGHVRRAGAAGSVADRPHGGLHPPAHRADPRPGVLTGAPPAHP